MTKSTLKENLNEQNHFKYSTWTDVAFPSHIHSYYEIILVKSGSLFAECTSQTFELREKDMIIFFPFELHTVYVSEKTEILILEASPSYFHSANIFFDNKHYQNPVCKFNDYDINFIEEHLKLTKIHPSIEISIIFYYLFSKFSLNSPLIDSKLFDKTLTQALKTTIDNSDVDITLKDVAKKLNINYDYLSKLFSRSNIKFNDFLNQHRVTKAMHSLRNTKKSISDICFECGFGSIRNFNKVFLKQMNCTPSQFRDSNIYQKLIKGAKTMSISNFDKKEWFSSRKWGLFHSCLPSWNNHYYPNQKTYKSFNDRINNFDVDKYAKAISELNPGYLFFTIMHNSQYMCAPNNTFDQITGYTPGEACSERDLILDLITALEKYDIPLFLSIDAIGPIKNAYAADKFGYYDIVSQYVGEDFIEKWSAVIREYAVRYKEKIHGWMFRCSYDRLGFAGHDDDFFKAFNDAVRSGNKNALIAFNNGEIQVDYKNPIFKPLLGPLKHSNEITLKLLELARAGNELACSAFQRKPGNNKRYSKYEDFTAGDTSYFKELPISKYVDGSLWHKIGPMGIPQKNDFPWPDFGWNEPGSIYSGDYLYEYIKNCNEKGGVVTIDFCMFDDCKFDWGQYEILKRLSSLR